MIVDCEVIVTIEDVIIIVSKNLIQKKKKYPYIVTN